MSEKSSKRKRRQIHKPNITNHHHYPIPTPTPIPTPCCSIMDEPEGNEADSKTKMAFAKMQAPQALREACVLTDAGTLSQT